MADKTAENYVNYQERATEFAVGDLVVPFGRKDEVGGRVTAVWPAIGMVDVEFSSGNKRYPVEDVQRMKADESPVTPPFTNSAPGEQPTVFVPGGPDASEPDPSTRRVAEAFVKRALYWSGPDRQYRATRPEGESSSFYCPKCHARGEESLLRPAIYKRRGGVSERLLGCGMCLFLIKQCDIVGGGG